LFDAVPDWQTFFAQQRSVEDHIFSLAASAGPSFWLAGGAVLAVAVELTRLRYEKRTNLRAWPDVAAPSGLA
jgi:hypothetical protein